MDQANGNAIVDPGVRGLEPGTRVEVLNSFGHWSRGFEVDAACDAGYRLRRLSDGSVLPVDVDAVAVRREKRKQEFWWF